MSFDITHAKMDRLHSLVPGLFRCLKKGERKKTKLDITYQHSKTERARLIGFEPLGADDLRLLQGLVAMGGLKGSILADEPKTEIGKQLRLNLDITANDSDALAFTVNITKLLKEIGLTNTGANIKAVKSSLLRLSNVTVFLESNNRGVAFKLLSFGYDFSGGTPSLFIALNHRLTVAILGGKQYTRIEMSEVRALKTDAARIIHQRLCAWINPGDKERKAELNTLCEYAWAEPATADAMKKRVQTARKALKEIQALGWGIKEYAPQKFEITRPKTNVLVTS